MRMREFYISSSPLPSPLQGEGFTGEDFLPGNQIGAAFPALRPAGLVVVVLHHRHGILAAKPVGGGLDDPEIEFAGMGVKKIPLSSGAFL
ncbi:MAG: hypothetical protein NT056_06205 [Proteobacteria bacterium]|nr:hypothetical protein [Pseudomonadota bacterium]